MPPLPARLNGTKSPQRYFLASPFTPPPFATENRTKQGLSRTERLANIVFFRLVSDC